MAGEHSTENLSAAVESDSGSINFSRKGELPKDGLRKPVVSQSFRLLVYEGFVFDALCVFLRAFSPY